MALALPTVLYFIPSASFEDTRNGRAYFEAGLDYVGQNVQGNIFRAYGPAARAAGIGENELLLAIDGVAAPVDWTAVAALLRKPQGTPVRLTLKAADGRVHDAVTHIDRRVLDEPYRRVGLTLEGRRLAEMIVDLASGVLALGFSTLLFLRRPRDPVAALIALGLTVAYALPSLMFGTLPHWVEATRSSLAVLAIFAGVAAFPDGRFTPRWSSLSVAVFALFLIADEFNYRELAPEIIAQLLVLLVLGIMGAAAIVRYRRTPSGIARQQIKFATLGIALFVAGSTVAMLLGLFARTITDEGVRAWVYSDGAIAGRLGQAGFYIGVLISLLRTVFTTRRPRSAARRWWPA